MLRAQQWINGVLGLEGMATFPEMVTLLGLPVPLAAALDGISALMRQAATRLDALPGRNSRYLAPQRPIDEGLTVELPNTDLSTPARLSQMEEPALFALGAVVALDALMAPTLDQAVDAVDWLLPGEERWISNIVEGDPERDRLAPKDRGPALYNALVLRHRSPEMRISSRLTFRTASAVPRWPVAADRAEKAADYGYDWPNQTRQVPAIPPRLVPQRLWSSVTALLPCPTRKDTPAFPAAMAMAVVRIGTFLPWRKIALGLVLPSHLASTIRAVWSRIDRAGLTSTVLARLDVLADALMSTPPPIDYGRRRRIFVDMTLVDERRFSAACRRSGLVATDRRRRYATMWLWERLTGGDIRLHPGDLAPYDPDDRTAYAAFRGRESRNLDRYLADEAERLLLRHRLDEPISWQPEPDGPDGAGWRCPPPDTARRLPGWVSPSKLPAARGARAHFDAVWQQLLEDPRDRSLDRLIRALPKFSLAGPPTDRPGDELVRIARDRRDRDWPGLVPLHRLQNRLGVQFVQPEPSDQPADSLNRAGFDGGSETRRKRTTWARRGSTP
ncbi:hypothetical protein, partial [Frankia nepalensis]|uniref:hypothetical protein n=1 Tax=Frankia nepalensis TaxID=1836974 RepID=UPI001EE3E4E1